MFMYYKHFEYLLKEVKRIEMQMLLLGNQLPSSE